MKKIILRWEKGNVLDIQNVYKTIIVEAESINDISPTIILPEAIRKKIHYIRTIYTSDTKRNYDYGSWTEFIEAEEEKQ